MALGILKKLFPFIAAAASDIGGPLGKLAANAVGSVLGISKLDATPQAIEQAVIGATPEQLEKLTVAEQEFAAKMQALGFSHAEEMEQLANADRASAREREEKTGDSWTPRLLAGLISLGFFGILGLIMFHEVPAGAKDAALLLLGALSTSFGAIVQYYFGSSSGSAAKSETLATIVKTNAAPPSGE